MTPETPKLMVPGAGFKTSPEGLTPGKNYPKKWLLPPHPRTYH